MGAMASQITSFTIFYSTVYSDADQRRHQSSASRLCAWPVNSPHKWSVRGKCFYLMTSSCFGPVPINWLITHTIFHLTYHATCPFAWLIVTPEMFSSLWLSYFWSYDEIIFHGRAIISYSRRVAASLDKVRNIVTLYLAAEFLFQPFAAIVHVEVTKGGGY